MRLLVVLLFMAVFFLSGIVYGMNKEQDLPTVTDFTEERGTEEEQNVIVETVSTPVSQPDITEASSVQYTQKTASILEAGVKGFFEVLMEFMYQIAKIFF
ncbi:hypothetical protein [Oceanobacillus damuensis]|uniref:hypothetical protein n=1 Tax=Oceanobacillus damuensis TaxID=937928 RepID=UPI00082F839D|nr:hypothetical protein [Oceanobacillus damuensis]